MVSFTGSTRAGIEIARAAAPTVKRVTQELGGKSPNIILDDVDLRRDRRRHDGLHAEQRSVVQPPTRMLVPASLPRSGGRDAKATAESLKVGDPFAADTRLGPVVSEVQWNKIQGLIKKGIEEGATLVTGGLGRPDGLTKGYFVRPTVFANVSNDMTIAREEIFGPVLSIIPYKTEEEAIAHRQRHDLRPRGLCLVGQSRARAEAWRAGSAPARSPSTARRRTSRRRSAATSSRAMAGSGACSVRGVLENEGSQSMVLEVAPLQIRPGQEAAFEAAFATAQSIIASMPGYRSHALQRCLERPGEYLLLVRWDSLEAHEVGFRRSPEYQDWKSLLHRFYDPFPTVLHYEPVAGMSAGDAGS